MNRFVLFGFIAVLSVSCGGLSGDSTLSGLSDDQIETLCADSTTRSEMCNGATITSDNSAECAAAVKSLPDDCVATVSDYETCDSAALCEKQNDAACGKIIACAAP